MVISMISRQRNVEQFLTSFQATLYGPFLLDQGSSDSSFSDSASTNECAHRRVEGQQILREACSRVYPTSASCVQRFDDSRNTAIRITYRISLRSSSLREPRYPLLRVVFLIKIGFLVLEL